MKFFFRLDSGLKIGLGHYARCYNIAKQLHKFGYEVFLITTKDRKINDNSIWKVIYVQDVSDVNEIKNILFQYNKNEINFIIDHYYIENSVEYQKEISNYINKLIIIEDLPNRQYYCDIFINWNIYAEKKDYEKLMLKEDTKILCGINYWLPGEGFVNLTEGSSINRENKPVNNKKIKMFVYLTGGDDSGLTLLSLKALEIFNYDIKCIIGNVNPNKDDIIAYCKEKPNINLYIQVNNIAEIMSKCDYAIGAFGQNTYERLILNLPTIGMQLVDNQALLAKYCEENNLAINLGWKDSVTIENIQNAVRDIQFINLNKLDFTQSNIANFIVLFCYQFQMRSMTLGDSQRVFNWRNQDFVRKAMKTQHIIKQEEHKEWSFKVLNSNTDKYFIFEYKNIPIGLICFNHIDREKKECEFGFYIGDTEYLGRNFGYVMEIFLVHYAFNNVDIDILYCYAMKTNLYAYNLYIRFGFEEYKQDENAIYLKLTKEKYLKIINNNIKNLLFLLNK